MSEQTGEVTRLLGAWRDGDREAFDELLPLVYDELRRMAHRQLRRGRPGDTLQTTALVHEAYMRLAQHDEADWRDKSHFLAVAALAMRQIVVDAARRYSAKKRGAGERPVSFDDVHMGIDVSGRAEEILAIDEALNRLADWNRKLARTVELRFFGGLTVEEAASVLEVSERTVKRDWQKAKAFLYRELGGEAV